MNENNDQPLSEPIGAPVLDALVFRRAADSSIDGIAIVDLNRRILYINKARARMHGYSTQDLIGRDVSMLTSGDAAAPISRQVLDSGHWQGEVTGMRSDGTTFLAWQTVSRVDDASGNPVAMLSITRDVTEQRKNEETLRLIVEGSPDFFFYIHDAQGIFTYVSPSVVALTGRSAEEWANHYSTFLTDSPVNRQVVEFTEATLRTGEVTPPYPVEIYHKDGHRIMLEVYERPIWEEGEIVGIRGVARDITQLVQAEEHKRRFYRDTILSVTDGKLVVCDHDDPQFTRGNPLASPLAITRPEHIPACRDLVRSAAEDVGMEAPLVDDLLLCVGEAATNALKHAGGGSLVVSDDSDVVRVRISDQGPGMDSLALPKLTLMKGYSTGKSLGMGYAAILSLATKVFLATDSTGTTVLIEKSKQPKAAALELANLPDFW